MKQILLAMLAILPTLGPSTTGAETVGTLALDGLSFVSFEDERVLPLSGGSITFHFGAPQQNGSIPFTIAPSDVAIPDISLPGGQTLRYGLASNASGQLSPSSNGLIAQFNATIAATITEGEQAGTINYSIPFTTESATASSGGETVQVNGVRIVPQARYVQFVGATVSKPNASLEPGAAVYTVLSGSFDQLP